MPHIDAYDLLSISINPDGTVTRKLQPPCEEANPNPGPGDGFATKDVTLDKDKKTWMRLFRPTKLPSNDDNVAKLPVVIFFRGGGFCLFSASNTIVHLACAQLSMTIPAILVSVEYRLAPEHRLPAQYEDALDAIFWVKNQFKDPNGEPWLRNYGDMKRCYLHGNGNGGNMILNAALRLLDTNLDPIKICGLIMNSPMFSGTQRTRSEIKNAADQLMPLPALDLMWELSLPKGTDRNHRFCNPMMDEPLKSKLGRLGRCLVIGFGGDPTIDRQQELVTLLVAKGVQVEAKFDDVGFQGIEMVDPRRAAAIGNYIKEFII